jgi:hypothetical protein
MLTEAYSRLAEAYSRLAEATLVWLTLRSKDD